MKHTLHCSSSAFVSFISRSTAAAVNPSACQQQEQQPLRECWTSPFSGGCSVCLEPCYSSLKARRCWKVIADVIEHWWLWPFGFFFFLLFFCLRPSLFISLLLPQLARNLPPRTIGYPWTLAFGTSKHGMSIKTLYRAMQGQDTPVLMVIKDSDGQVSFIFYQVYFWNWNTNLDGRVALKK